MAMNGTITLFRPFKALVYVDLHTPYSTYLLNAVLNDVNITIANTKKNKNTNGSRICM
jgi:hypothetical protein